MRKQIGSAVLVAALVVTGMSASWAQAAQTRKVAYGFAGGLALPLGDYGDVDKLGFTLGAGASFQLGTSPVRLRIEGTWVRTSHDFNIDGRTQILGGMGSIVYPFQTTGQVKPYILGGVGYYVVDIEAGTVSGDESKVGFGGGAGLLFPMTSSDVFVEARFLSVSTSGSSTTWVPIIVGIRFGR